MDASQAKSGPLAGLPPACVALLEAKAKKGKQSTGLSYPLHRHSPELTLYAFLLSRHFVREDRRSVEQARGVDCSRVLWPSQGEHDRLTE